jgi:glycosyltransferase involved in cell wall biosynthesis
VVPNYIDYWYRKAWDNPTPQDPAFSDFTVIGWAGGHQHQEDYLPIGGALRQVLEERDDVRFAICSSKPMGQEFVTRLKLPVEKVIVLNPVPFEDYPNVLSQFDIGLAPVRPTTFNRAKSDLKLKEYGSLGVPYVATDIAPYRRFHNHTQGKGGYLASSPSEWYTGIKFLLDEEERTARGGLIRSWCRSHYDLLANVGEWADALRQARNGGAITVWSDAEKPGRNRPCPCGSEKKYKVCCIPAFG